MGWIGSDQGTREIENKIDILDCWTRLKLNISIRTVIEGEYSSVARRQDR